MAKRADGRDGLERLARRAVAGDLSSARRIVEILEARERAKLALRKAEIRAAGKVFCERCGDDLESDDPRDPTSWRHPGRHRCRDPQPSNPPLIATFHPQRWDEDDYAVDAGPAQHVDVTVAVLSLDANEVRNLSQDYAEERLVPPDVWPKGEGGTGRLDLEDQLDDWLAIHGLWRGNLTEDQWDNLRAWYDVGECEECRKFHEFFADCEGR